MDSVFPGKLERGEEIAPVPRSNGEEVLPNAQEMLAHLLPGRRLIPAPQGGDQALMLRLSLPTPTEPPQFVGKENGRVRKDAAVLLLKLTDPVLRDVPSPFVTAASQPPQGEDALRTRVAVRP